MTITRKGKELLSKTREVVKPGTLEGPQVAGYAQRDNKFLCGACGGALDKHSAKDRAEAWMCGSCGQVYVDACLTMLNRLGTPRTICTGSSCSAARRKLSLSKVLRKIGAW